MRRYHWFYTLPLRARSLFRRAKVEAELAEELEFHIERRAGELIAGGMQATDARLTAAREFHRVEQLKEEARAVRARRAARFRGRRRN